MSFRTYVRMAQFPMMLVERVDGVPISPDARGICTGEGVTGLTTVHWTVKRELGLPALPFEVWLYPEPLLAKTFSHVLEGTIRLTAPDLEISLLPSIAALNGEDALCVTARLRGDPAVEIYAIDAAGEEIAETRQSADAPHGTAFVGPGIMGLRATGTVAIVDPRIFAVRPNIESMRRLATVAPALKPVDPWEPQEYLGQQFAIDEALALRLAMDAVARANCPPPSSTVLEQLVHRENAGAIADRARASDTAQAIIDHFQDILNDPDWSQDVPVGRGATFKIYPARMLQMLASSDPVSATTLGHAVTLPLFAPFKPIASLADIFARVEQEEILPYPLIRIAGHHQAKEGTLIRDSQFACLTFADRTPEVRLRLGKARPPESLDTPALGELRISLDQRSAALAAFVDRSDGLEEFVLDPQGRPANIMADSRPDDLTEAGLPSFPVGPVALPFTGPEPVSLRVHARDVFGRWRPQARGSSKLDPWPVQKPHLSTVTVDYLADGMLSAAVDIGWDWTKRTPYEIRIGLCFCHDAATAEAVSPADGVHLPGDAPVPLAIRFDHGYPHFAGAVPPSWSIAALPDYLEDVGPLGEPPNPVSDFRRYRLRIELGAAKTIFNGLAEPVLGLAADAWEVVSGQTPERRSERAWATKALHDPRPPVLKGTRWRLEWASRVDAANRAHAFIDPMTLVTTPVAGFFVWRAHESALCDLGLAENFDDKDKADRFHIALRAERDMAVRLAMIEGLIEPHVHKPAFMRALVDLFEVDDGPMLTGPGEIAISGAQGGLEFVMISAVSKTLVPSDKMDLVDLRAIAIPFEIKRKPPVLRVIRPDVETPFAKAGLIALAVGAEMPFSREDAQLFWDNEPGVKHADELLHRIAPLSELTVRQLDSYQPGASRVLARLGLPYWRFFAVRPPPSWARHYFTVVLCAAAQLTPADAVATPRAMLQHIDLAPAAGPTLVVLTDIHTPTSRSIVIVLSSILEMDIPNFAPSMIQIDLLDKPTDPPASAPVPFARFVRDGIEITEGADRIRLASATGSGQIAVKSTIFGKTLRVAVSDPAGRSDVLTLDL
ncbi:hypothetical protein [Cupriavidus pinatubonensis]|uniref:Uncharacterized protein n=1 Tax=Cupriavidus pinatubonensis TaxID=248026 RepID=A0ABM8XU56_9BURK|nr:hypothetical protein [Cupriavidus pinatubonensis]CAG9183901.1 hypothetical protein LMG23994_05259 [Cupriavidus pinatubonensis]